MKNWKKLTAFLLALCSMFSFTLPVHADLNIIGTTKVTDIVAFIDTHGIPCYNYNGYTFISAENLQFYGFDVNWNMDTQTLTVDYNPAKYVTAEHGIPNEPDFHFGADMHRIYSSDNQVIMNGYPIEAYSIDGQMIINFDNLSCLGEVVWNSDLRTIYVTTDRFRNVNADWQDTLPAYIASMTIIDLGIAVLDTKVSVLHSMIDLLDDVTDYPYYFDKKQSLASYISNDVYSCMKNLRNNLQNRCQTLNNAPHFYLKNEILRAYKEVLVESNAYIDLADYIRSIKLQNLIDNDLPQSADLNSAYLNTFLQDLRNKAMKYIQLEY